MKTHIKFVLVAAFAASCGSDVANLNNPNIDDILEDPSPAEVNATATGLLNGARRDMPNPNGYVAMLGILGRENYNFDGADARFITEMIGGELSGGSPAFGGNFWTNPYRNIRTGLLLLGAVELVNPALYTEEQRQGVRGFAKTIMAYEYMQIINTRYDNGAVIVTSTDLHTLDPIVTRPEVEAYTTQLLDEAKLHLEGAGMAFAFPLSSGFEGFDTPATFIEFNRALRARNEAYRGNHQAVLDSLAESFITADAANPQLDLGVYHAFGTGSGDTLNGLSSPNLFAHPSVVADAEPGDRRVASKVRSVASRTVQMLTSDKGFSAYLRVTAKISYIRNEELILLRAEANIGLGNIPAAAADLNFIRVQSGGLAARNDITAGNAEDELLEQRRYSLLFEGGHRWIDMRRFGRLDELPLDREGDRVHVQFPIPDPETIARRP